MWLAHNLLGVRHILVTSWLAFGAKLGTFGRKKTGVSSTYQIHKYTMISSTMHKKGTFGVARPALELLQQAIIMHDEENKIFFLSLFI